jgi:hypothetical protein
MDDSHGERLHKHDSSFPDYEEINITLYIYHQAYTPLFGELSLFRSCVTVLQSVCGQKCTVAQVADLSTKSGE